MPGQRPRLDPANLVAALVARDYAASARRGARSAGLYGVAAVLIGTCYTAAVAGVAIFLGQRYGAVVGAFIVAGGALVLAVGLIVAVQAINRAERRREDQRSRNRRAAIAITLRVLPAVLSRKALLPLALAGLIFGFATTARKDGPQKDGT